MNQYAVGAGIACLGVMTAWYGFTGGSIPPMLVGVGGTVIGTLATVATIGAWYKPTEH